MSKRGLLIEMHEGTAHIRGILPESFPDRKGLKMDLMPWVVIGILGVGALFVAVAAWIG